jgi:uncharacterized damage-inducible protein DinB
LTEDILVKLFEHNNWANLQIIQSCVALSGEQLDAEPQIATKGSFRRTLLHLVHSQEHYLSLLSLPLEARDTPPPAFTELRQSAILSGEGLLSLAKGKTSRSLEAQLRTSDGYLVEPWVVMLQAINHATEHREQIKSMLSSLGITPPEIDGWDYGFATNALIPETP